jgi:Crinkler effector protein N-terminal domain
MPPRKASSKGKRKASAIDEEENFALNILVLGEMSCFLVEIPQNVRVNQLRETIYQKRERRLRDIQADDLTLYKVGDAWFDVVGLWVLTRLTGRN